MPGEGASSGHHNGEVPVCAVCGCIESRKHRLTWQLSRLDITLKDEVAVKDWMERRQGQPSAMVLPDDGEVLAYSVAPYCEACLDKYWREYEERHTPSGKVNRAAFQEKIRAFSRTAGWDLYVPQLEYLAPRGFPNMALKRGDRLILPSVRGNVIARPRAFHPPGHSLVISPEVPEDIREALTRDPDEGRTSEKVAFLYMDEKYPDTKAPPAMQVTSLTGLLIASDQFLRFRDEFFKIVPGFDQGADNFPVDIHASNLFPGRPDDEHFRFYSGLVSIINDFKCKVYRRGFNFMPGHELLRKKQIDLVGFCFRSMLISVDDFEHFGQIWPVMETDHSMRQDENFAGYMRWMDQATSYLNWVGDGVEELIDEDYMVDNSRFGDLHYVTKKSIGGIAADCLAYLLHCRWLEEKGFLTSGYKARLSAIASTLRPSIVDDYVGSFRLENEREDPNSPKVGPEETYGTSKLVVSKFHAHLKSGTVYRQVRSARGGLE